MFADGDVMGLGSAPVRELVTILEIAVHDPPDVLLRLGNWLIPLAGDVVLEQKAAV